MNAYLELTLRALGAFIAVAFITRLIGKSQMNNLTVTDFVNGIIVGSIAAVLATDLTVNAAQYVYGLAVFTALVLGLEYLSLKFRPVRKKIEGEPTIVIHNGKILEGNMAKILYNLDNLLMQLREKGAFNIAEVEFAVVEPNGELSVLLKSQRQPVTRADLNLPSPYKGISVELVMDGKVVTQNLGQLHLTEEWLFKELEKKGIFNLQDVVFASLDTEGNLYVDTRRDTMDNYMDIMDSPKDYQH